LKTNAPIVSQAAASKNRLFVGSLDGFVYGVNEMTGILDWDVSTGQGILNAPVPFGDELYVVSRANELFKIDAEQGTYPEGWQVPIRGVKKVAGFGVETVYCIDVNNRLIGINRDTQTVTKSVRNSSIQFVMPNGITDRMFFATKEGFIQCVHEIGSLRPRFLESDLAIAKPKKEMKGRDDDSAIGEKNPFGDDAEEANPFGSDDEDDNPFGGETSSEDEDDEDEDDDDNPFGNG